MTIRTATLYLGTNSTIRHRNIRFSIREVNTHWWKLTVLLEVYYTFGRARSTLNGRPGQHQNTHVRYSFNETGFQERIGVVQFCQNDLGNL